MITKMRVVLLAERKYDFLDRFEALEFISDESKIQDVWSRNKTPIMSEYSMNIVEYNVLKIPEELIGDVEAFTDFCHHHEFECGEYRNGQVFDTRLERCFLCELARHKGFADMKLYNQYVDKTVDCIVYESANFYVVPELGALKQGYLMIVPKKHILSVAQFPEEMMPEYQEVCRDVEQILLKTFKGKMVCFLEHGSGPSGKTSHKKSIVHAHTHVVVDFMLKNKFKEMVQLKPCDDISQASNVHYFSYQEGANGQLMISMDPRVYVQRQFPRQVMADELGLAPDQYNWRWYEFDEVTDATLFHLCRYLKTEREGRIFERTREFVEGFSLRAKKRDF